MIGLKNGCQHDGSVIFEDLTNSTGVLVVAGPKARQLMERVST
jgi:dimethylglycine dehydrogenase